MFIPKRFILLSMGALCSTTSVRAVSVCENPLIFAATFAGTVALSKIAYDTVSAIPYLLPCLFQRMPIPGIKVGLVQIVGPITDDVSSYLQQIEYYTYNDSFKGIFVYINSGGGYPGPSDLLYRALKEARDKKPVVVFVDSCCGSGAYLIACGANYIMITGLATVGSIGVWRDITRFTEHPKRDDGFVKGTIAFDYLTAGDYKLAGVHPEKPLNAAERNYLQEMTNQVYDYFSGIVAQERNLDINNRADWANGRVFIGPKAVEEGLADRVGSWHEAQIVMKNLIVEKNPTNSSAAKRSLNIVKDENAQLTLPAPSVPSEDLLTM